MAKSLFKFMMERMLAGYKPVNGECKCGAEGLAGLYYREASVKLYSRTYQKL